MQHIVDCRRKAGILLNTYFGHDGLPDKFQNMIFAMGCLEHLPPG